MIPDPLTKAKQKVALIEEKCTCGHFRREHEAGEMNLELGHGACTLCECIKFTWDGTSGPVKV